MTENDNTETLNSISDDELLLNHVTEDDSDLYFLDCFLSEIYQKG